jgi:iron-sulfur cluster repair protein YtfE (RIC family)
MDLKHSEVRRVVLGEHEVLRAELTALSTLINEAEQQQPGAAEKLVHGWRHFARILLDHLEHEEAVLRPALEGIDAWAEVRVDHLDTDHVRQRARVAQLLQSLEPATAASAAADLRAFLAELTADMEEEERLNLSEELLRDYAVPYSSGFSG